MDVEQAARWLRTGVMHMNGAFAGLTAYFDGYKQFDNGREMGAPGSEFLEMNRYSVPISQAVDAFSRSFHRWVGPMSQDEGDEEGQFG